nr:tetratricopeptide repeat protein [uncultured Rhodoferax sp.]
MLESKLQQALSLHQNGQLTQARAIYEDILKLQPAHADALQFLGVVENHHGNHARAVKLIEKSIAIFPHNPSSYLNLGNALREIKQLQGALVCYNKAISLKPDYALAYSNRGVVLQAMKRLDDAVSAFDTAIALKPDYIEAHYNRANALKDLGKMEAAVASYDAAISLFPDFADAHLNRGSALMELSKFGMALQSFETAAALRPDQADAHWNMALLLLLTGNLTAGWPLHEWRWKVGTSDNERRSLAKPLWLGEESLQGKTVLLYGEQGLGDSIQFVRYVKQVADLGAHVLLEAPLQLKNLFESVEGAGELVLHGQPVPVFDFHCPLLSLPLAFNTTLESIPASSSYLQAEPDRIRQWANKLGHPTRKRVGLAWSGNAKHGNDHNRSVPLSTLLQYLPDGFEYISLQKELRDSDQSILVNAKNIRHLGTELTDFSDTAALCELMDLVISVDTSIAHLAGALGKPLWVLLPHVPDWRWLLARGDSPWYPSASLYRQASPRDWGSALEKVNDGLNGLLTEVD